MNYGSDFEILKDTRASLQFLIMLLDPRTSNMERLEPLDKGSKANINRHQFYQIVKRLQKLKPIEDEISQRRGKKVIITKLTDKRIKIANLVLKIKDLLEAQQTA